MRICRAFGVELLSPKTNDSGHTKAHERYCSTFTLSGSVYVEYDPAAIETNRLCRAVHPGSGDDLVSHIWRRLTALGGIRVRQLDRLAA